MIKYGATFYSRHQSQIERLHAISFPVSPIIDGANIACGVPPTSTSFTSISSVTDSLVKDIGAFTAKVTNYGSFGDTSAENRITFDIAVMLMSGGTDGETHTLSITANGVALGDVTFSAQGEQSYPVSRL